MTQNELQELTVQKCLDYFKKRNKGYLDYAMRSGKTAIALKFLQKFYDYDPTVLIAYPDNKLLEGWMSECHKWGYVNPNITYVNFSSLKKYKTKVFDVLIVDEFHSTSDFETDSCHQIMTNDENTKTLLLSGTVTEETKDKWGVAEIAKYTTLDGIRDGILASYSITVHMVDLDTKVITKNKAGKPKTEKQRYDGYSWVIAKNRREVKATMNLALARNRLSLSSVGKLNYVKKLLKTLEDKRVLVFTGLSDVADSIGIPSYHSKSTSNVNFTQFQAGIIDQLALAEMGKSGVTYPQLDSVVLMNFTYSPENSAQILNRAVMLDYKEKIADLHIICLNEDAEIKKIKESLSMLDKTKIKYVKN